MKRTTEKYKIQEVGTMPSTLKHRKCLLGNGQKRSTNRKDRSSSLNYMIDKHREAYSEGKGGKLSLLLALKKEPQRKNK